MYKIGICSEQRVQQESILAYCRSMIKVRSDAVEFYIFTSVEEICAYQGKPFVFLFLDMKLVRFVNMEQYWKLQQYAQFVVCINKCRERMSRDEKFHLIMIPEQSENVIVFKRSCPEGYVPESAIRYVHAESNYVRVHLREKIMMFAKTLKAVEQLTKDSDIIRIHRSVMVNLSYVEGIRNNHVILYDQTCLPIGRSYKETVRGQIVTYKSRQ